MLFYQIFDDKYNSGLFHVNKKEKDRKTQADQLSFWTASLKLYTITLSIP